MDRNRNRRRRGNAAIEFALGFSVLFALFSGAFQYGYSLWIYNELASAVTDGAAYASRTDYCAANTTFSDSVKQMVVYGDPTTTSGSSRIPSLTTSNVTVTATPSTFPKSITIAISNFTVNALFTSFTFSNKPAVTMTYLGNYQPSGC